MRPDSTANSPHSDASPRTPNPQAEYKRNPTPGEIELARLVFSDAIDYSRVKIHRGGLFGIPTRTGNAMTPRGEIYFPDTPDGYQTDFSQAPESKQIWLMHELTHVWQYQLGYSVLFGALKIRLRGGYANDGARPAPAYRYNLQGEDIDKPLPQFNMEQQGELISHYFDANFLTGIHREQQHAARVANLPALRNALSEFLTQPGNHELLPQTTAIEPHP